MALVVVVIAAAVVLVIAGMWALARGRHDVDDGVTSFRRHIDALSPEARREVIDRVKNARETGKGK